MDDPTTINTVHDDGSMSEMDLDAEQAARRERGESYGSYEIRRFSNKDAIARLTARIDQIEAERDQLVNDHPGLKSLPIRRPPDDHAA